MRFSVFDSGKDERMEKNNNVVRDVTETVGVRIRSGRKALGYSQEKFSELLSIKQNTLSRYENDEHAVPMDILSMMAGILGTTPSYLLWGNNADDTWIAELTTIAGSIKNPAIRETAIKQMMALVQMDEAMR